MNLRSQPVQNHRRKRRFLRLLQKRRGSNPGATNKSSNGDASVNVAQIDKKHELFETKRKIFHEKEGIELLKPRDESISDEDDSVPKLIEISKSQTSLSNESKDPSDQLPEALSVPEKKNSKNPSVRFADDAGKDLEDVHYVWTMYSRAEEDEENPDYSRAIILLLSPSNRKFEFVHVSYDSIERTPIKSIVKQLCDLATHQALQSQNYSCLVRAESGREMLNSAPIQAYDLRTDTMLVAVLKGMYANTTMKMAKPLLENKKITRAVRNAKKNGHKVTHLRGLRPHGKAEEDAAEITLRKKAQVAPSGPTANPADESPEEALQRAAGEMDKWDQPPGATRQYFKESENQDKANVARILNFGIITAVLFGSEKKKRQQKR